MGRSARSADLANLFAALADRTRLRLLNLINGREVCVCYFVEILKQSQPKVSRHLAYLRKAGVVRTQREGKWMHYRIEQPASPRWRLFWTQHRDRDLYAPYNAPEVPGHVWYCDAVIRYLSIRQHPDTTAAKR